jgi:hypothetical protein
MDSLWRTARWPVLLLAVAGVCIALATVLDQTFAREYALVIGAPALTLMLPIGLLWLTITVVIHAIRRRTH